MNWFRKGLWTGVLIAMIALDGCDLKAIDSFSTVLAIGIDQGPGGNILLTMEIANFSKSKSPQIKTQMVTGQGSSVEEAEKDIQLRNPQELYLAHNTLILLGARYASRNIGEVVDFVQRNRFLRPTIVIAVCKETAEEVLNSDISTESISAFGLRDMIDQASTRSLSISSEMIRWLRDLHHHSETFQLAALKMDGDAKPEVAGEGLFQRGRLARWIPTEEAPFLILLSEHRISDQLIPVAYADKERVYLRVLWANVTVKLRAKGEQLVAQYQVRGEAEVAEPTRQMAFTPKKLARLESKLNLALQAKTQQMIRSLQDARIDGMNLADAVYREQPNIFRHVSTAWDDHFAKANISAEFAIRVIRTGLMN